MTLSNDFPRASDWLDGAGPTHPLLELIAIHGEDAELVRSVLAQDEELISRLVAASPNRMPTVRRSYKNAASQSQYLEVRAELVVARKVLLAGIDFEFGQVGRAPQPDLLLESPYPAIEVTSRRIDGIRDLHDELEEALELEGLPCTVQLHCDEDPLGIKEQQRQDIVRQTVGRAKTAAWGRQSYVLENSWATTSAVHLAVDLINAPPLVPGLRVTMSSGPLLTGHLLDAGREVLAILDRKAKRAQARDRPTVLLVDVARLGRAWLRHLGTWIAALEEDIPVDCPYIGLGVFVQTLGSSDITIGLARRSSLTAEEAQAISDLAAHLGAITAAA